MVRTILWYLFWAMIILIIVLWLVSGGIGNIRNTAATIGNPLKNLKGGTSFMLPWQVPIPQGPDITKLIANTGSDSGSDASDGPDQSQAQTFGNPSPSQGGVIIDTMGAIGSTPQSEYVEIENSGNAPLDITGWSLQSALTGARSYIPRGASLFLMGAVNKQNDIELVPGGTAIITTGTSPVGTSFQINECSGYLGQLQNYTPQIQSACPDPSAMINQAAAYGQDCVDFVNSLSSCQFPNPVPSNLSGQCQTFVQTNFSYNGCVQAHDNDSSGFATNSWRIYLNASRELWNNSHDTIRLLDSQGEIVAVASY